MEEQTIAQLAAIYFRTPEDELERSLAEYERGPEDPKKEALDQNLSSSLGTSYG